MTLADFFFRIPNIEIKPVVRDLEHFKMQFSNQPERVLEAMENYKLIRLWTFSFINEKKKLVKGYAGELIGGTYKIDTYDGRKENEKWQPSPIPFFLNDSPMNKMIKSRCTCVCLERWWEDDQDYTDNLKFLEKAMQEMSV